MPRKTNKKKLKKKVIKIYEKKMWEVVNYHSVCV